MMATFPTSAALTRNRLLGINPYPKTLPGGRTDLGDGFTLIPAKEADRLAKKVGGPPAVGWEKLVEDAGKFYWLTRVRWRDVDHWALHETELGKRWV